VERNNSASVELPKSFYVCVSVYIYCIWKMWRNQTTRERR